MSFATVLIPTFDHGRVIRNAIASVQAQTVPDFELFVVGDGAPEETRALMHDLCADDTRITFFDNPKGEGFGEQYRHAALQQARGDIVCYLCDDDLWLPHHLETLGRALESADFAHTMHIDITDDGTFIARVGDLADLETQRQMLRYKWNFFGPSCAGHRLDAYRRLPFGWRPKPKDMWSDLHMWRQWLTCDWVRFRSIAQPTALQLTARWRQGLTPEQRDAEVADWLPRLEEDDFEEWLYEQIYDSWQRQLTNLRKQLTYLRNSKSWKMTQPLRDVGTMIDNLLPR